MKTGRKDGPQRRGGAWRKAWYTTSVGIEVAGCIVVGLLLGRWLDTRFDTYPILMIVGFAAGIAAAGKAIWRVVRREMKDEEAGEGDER